MALFENCLKKHELTLYKHYCFIHIQDPGITARAAPAASAARATHAIRAARAPHTVGTTVNR